MTIPLASEIAAYLSDPSNAVMASSFPVDRDVVRRPGLYSWWADDEGRQILGEVLGAALPSLIYAGQTGAASSVSARASAATLESRIGQHLRGTAYGSTFRKSISAMLRESLGLVVDRPDRLAKADNDRVSEWMRNHLSVAVYPFDGRVALGVVESEVLAILDPPLNLDGRGPSPVRQRLTKLRRQIARPVAPESPNPSRDGGFRIMIPSSGPEDWRQLLADPALNWVTGRSARTLAYAWESASGWPPEVGAALEGVPELARLQPLWAFPELKTPLPGGNRASQTDLFVFAGDGSRLAAFAVEGKVDEPFGEPVELWLGSAPSPGKQQRLAHIAGLLGVEVSSLGGVHYQLLHRAAAAKIEGARMGADVVGMPVHSWAARMEGFPDFAAFAGFLGAEATPGVLSYSAPADLWLGWVIGDPKYLAY